MDNTNYYCMRFYVTYKCNSKCHYCNVWRENQFRHVPEMEPEEAKELIRQCYEAGVRYIDFTGGEPTLCKGLPDMIRYAKSLGIKTEVTSNAVSGKLHPLTEIARDADKFNVSLDTIHPDKYRVIRGIDGFYKVEQALKQLKDIRYPKLMVVVSEENFEELDQMVRYAQENETEIYLNPMFTYAGMDGAADTIKYIEKIMEKTYEPYTVVMLHFMEFLRQEKGAYRPPCSANVRTLTFAPDGSLVLPCYHALQETVPWDGNLRKMLETEAFQKYHNHPGMGTGCTDCAVLPYFGISFNYCLDSYFLIQSYSEKLHHLKRDYLNPIKELEPDKKGLGSLNELLQMVRTLKIDREKHFSGLYRVQKEGAYYRTEVYRELLPEGHYKNDLEADDCWQLQSVPHRFFDKIEKEVWKPAFLAYQSGNCGRDIVDIFRYAEEFQLHYWKYFIAREMNVIVPFDIEEERQWVQNYLLDIARTDVWLGS